MEAEVGMLVVETISKIRRAYFVHGQPIKAICRELGVSRKVVRKVIRSEATEFRYERETQPLPKMGPWRCSPTGFLDLEYREHRGAIESHMWLLLHDKAKTLDL